MLKKNRINSKYNLTIIMNKKFSLELEEVASLAKDNGLGLVGIGE